MLRAMAFIDYQNFNINLTNYFYQKYGRNPQNIHYSSLAKEIVKNVKVNCELLKTVFFVPKPCEQLLALEKYQRFNNWIETLKQQNFFEIVEGTHVVKPREGYNSYTIDINNYKTYYVEEKGTDINIAVNILSKAYNNSYDIAILLSSDTDFIPIISELKRMGKLVVLASLPNQNVYKFRNYYDQQITIHEEMVNKCILRSDRSND